VGAGPSRRISWGDKPEKGRRGQEKLFVVVRSYLRRLGCAARVLADEVNDLVHPGARCEDRAHSEFFQTRHIFIGDDSAAKDDYVCQPCFPRQINDSREKCHMRAGQNRQPDRIDVFLHGSAHDHLGSLAETGVDDFHPGVSKRARDDFDAAIVPVKSGLREEYSYSFFRH